MGTTTAPKKPTGATAAPTQADKVTTVTAKVNLAEIKKGDVFSESSHYVLEDIAPGTFGFRHVESSTRVTLDRSYVEHLLTPADQYIKEVEVGKEDKFWTEKQIEEAISKNELPKDVKLQPRAGDIKVPGIRTIWSNIHGYDVFAVCYVKQDKKKAAKELKAEKDALINSMLEQMSKAKSRDAAAAVAQAELVKSFDTPLLDYIPGEERVLRGFKTQFESVTGQYDVIDLDIAEGENAKRQVNVNTISWLVYHGVRYIVK